MQRHPGPFVWDEHRDGHQVSDLHIVDVPPDRNCFTAEQAERLTVRNVVCEGGRNGFLATGEQIDLIHCESHGAAESAAQPHGTTRTYIRSCEFTGWEVGGVHVQGPSEQITIQDVWSVDGNRRGGVSADAITAYDHGNREVRVVGCRVGRINDHHGIHISGAGMTLAGNKCLGGIDPGYAAFMAGHTRATPSAPQFRGYHLTAVGNVGLGQGTASYGLWVRFVSNWQLLGGTLQDFARGVYVEGADNGYIGGGAVLAHNSTAAVYHAKPGDLAFPDGHSYVEGSRRRLITVP